MSIVGLAIEFVLQTAFLTLALWVLVKLQKLQFTFLGLVISAAVATVFDLIPYVGHYLAVPVLFLCMLKATREDTGSIIFTVGVSYALTFGMNLWLLGSMMGDLRVSARTSAPVMPAAESVAATDNLDPEFLDEEAPEAPQPTAAQPAAPQAKAAPAKEAAAATPAPAAAKPLTAKTLGLTLKGIVKGPQLTTVILSVGSKTYSLVPGDSFQLAFEDNEYEVSLAKVKDNSVLLNIAGQQVEVFR